MEGRGTGGQIRTPEVRGGGGRNGEGDGEGEGERGG
jgi:hypothetical protein